MVTQQEVTQTSPVFTEKVQLEIRKYILSRAEALLFQIDKLSYINKLRLIDVLVFNKSEKILGMQMPAWFVDGEVAWANLLSEQEVISLGKVSDWLLSVEESPSELEKFKLEVRKLLGKANFSLTMLSRLLRFTNGEELYSLQKQLWTKKTVAAALFELPTERKRQRMLDDAASFKKKCAVSTYSELNKRVLALYEVHESLSLSDIEKLFSLMVNLNLQDKIEWEKFSHLDQSKFLNVEACGLNMSYVYRLENLESRLNARDVIEHVVVKTPVQKEPVDIELLSSENSLSSGKAKRKQRKEAKKERYSQERVQNMQLA